MPHGLDHIVHAVRDLDAAAEFYASAGFTVGARNRHPWGTHNRIVQFPGLLHRNARSRPSRRRSCRTAARSFSFGAFNRDFLARDEGLSMLILEGNGAAADARAFDSGRHRRFRACSISRARRKRPDGIDGQGWRSRWRLRSDPKASPDVRFCGVPASLSGEFLESGVSDPSPTARLTSPGVAMVAENPADHSRLPAKPLPA